MSSYELHKSVMVFLPYARFGNENPFAGWDFHQHLDADSEVVTKQLVATVVDIMPAPHGNPEISLI